jgi:hypothetical protein
MTIAEKPQGYTQLYKWHISAHMCTIKNTEKLCKGALEACSVVMAPLVKSCGRGAWVSTMRGAHKKSARATCPWRWGQGQCPAPGTSIVAGPGFILGNHNQARRPCPSQSSSSTVRQSPSFDGGNVGATAGMGGNPACDYPGAVEIATRWTEYNGCVGELKLGDKPKFWGRAASVARRYFRCGIASNPNS